MFALRDHDLCVGQRRSAGEDRQGIEAEIGDGETVTRDFNLSPTTIEGSEVVVTAQSQGQLQAINQQISSNKIVSVVSEAKIQELPDFNAAAAIGRLPIAPLGRNLRQARRGSGAH